MKTDIMELINANTNEVKRELENMILTCCSNAWHIPTDQMKKDILISKGWHIDDIEEALLEAINEIPDATPEKNKEVALNTLLTNEFYLNSAEDLYIEDYEGLVYQVMYEFGRY